MSKFLQIISLAILIFHSLNCKSQTYLITGTVQQTSSYCGGARPPQEILDNFKKPLPYANKIFYVRIGEINSLDNKIITKFTSDSSGNFTIRLPQGIYSILVEEQIKPIEAKDYITKLQTVDEKCLQTWWQKPYYLLVVKKKNEPLNFNFHHRCYLKNDIPCVTYIGPVHP
jgi:hypothetical protein